MTTYYTPRAGSITIYAAVLEEDAKSLKQSDGFLDHQELDDCIREEYGNDVMKVRYAELHQILHSRLVHSQEMLDLLKKHGDLLGKDLSQSIVYGSYNRPIDGMWASIPDAVYIHTKKWDTGYHTYVAVPTELDKETIDRYELRFVSFP